jgi:hypothetical protein
MNKIINATGKFSSTSLNLSQLFLMEKAWSLPQELVLKFIVSWVNADPPNREDLLMQVSMLYKLRAQMKDRGFALVK